MDEEGSMRGEENNRAWGNKKEWSNKGAEGGENEKGKGGGEWEGGWQECSDGGDGWQGSVNEERNTESGRKERIGESEGRWAFGDAVLQQHCAARRLANVHTPGRVDRASLGEQQCSRKRLHQCLRPLFMHSTGQQRRAGAGSSVVDPERMGCPGGVGGGEEGLGDRR